MESISSSMKKYWRRRGGYRRLNGSNWWRRRRDRVEHLGDTTAKKRRRRRWRVKISPKIKISRIPSPKKLLLWLRDAYVRMMLGLANSKMMGINGSATGYGGGIAPASIAMGSLNNKPKEYDEKMIIHIYKSLMMNKGQLVPRDDPAPKMVN